MRPVTASSATPDPTDASLSAEPFRHLFASGQIGPMSLHNRVIMTPMGDRLAHDDGTISPRQSDYLEARARGASLW
jgi:2,4-dienoyl-CoA reductase-like NADH-dependent reductase (Old Yellow Enzyme family)